MNIKFQVNTHGSSDFKKKLVDQFRKYIWDNVIYSSRGFSRTDMPWLQFTINTDIQARCEITHFGEAWKPDEYQIVSLDWALEKMAEVNLTKHTIPQHTMKPTAEIKCTTYNQVLAILRHFEAKGWDIDLNQHGRTLEDVAKEYFEKYPYIVLICRLNNVTGNSSPWHNKALSFIEAFDYTEVASVNVPLNKEYTATVKPNGEVTVGCQWFTSEAILKLADEVKKMLDLKK